MKSVRQFVGERFASQLHKSEGEAASETTIVVTTPKLEDVTITESFVCQIRSQRHIEVRTLEGGYINQISINEGQAVKKGDEVRLVGFGTFTVARRAASEGRNPRTGEKIQIPASKQPKFKAGKGLKDAIN